MGKKGGVKEKFSFGVISAEKSEKAHLSAYGGYAAGLPACFLTQERYLLSRRASRTLERDCCTVSFPRCRRDA